MKIIKLGINKKEAVVILGAGASRGAKCFENSLLPAPLDTDFFYIMQRVQHLDPILTRFMKFLRKEFGDGTQPRMEELFTQLEALKSFHESTKFKQGPPLKKYTQQLEKFVDITASFFRRIFLNEKNKMRVCTYHDTLAKALYSGDTVISFNYDCLIDSSLRRCARRRWSADQGYGLEIEDGSMKWNPPASIPGRPSKTPIKLLKLHGSLNWERSAPTSTQSKKIKLRPNPYSATSRNRCEIIPPVWDKRISNDEVFKTLWKDARNAFSTGQILLVAGYSVPQTDLLSQALIRVAVSERSSDKKLTHLIVANPDQAARAKLVDLVKTGLSPRKAIIELSSMRELSELLA